MQIMNEVRRQILTVLGTKTQTLDDLIVGCAKAYPRKGWRPGPVGHSLAAMRTLGLVVTPKAGTYKRTPEGTKALKS
jgi:hypothetical protein